VINIKTFYGARKQFTFKLNIKERIYSLIPMICIDESNNPETKKKWDINNQYRFIKTNGKISEISPLNNFIDANLKFNETIILLFPKKISFSEVLKSPHIYVIILFKIFS